MPKDFLPWSHPTLLKTPGLPAAIDPAIYGTWPAAHCLPLEPQFYEVTEVGGQWLVRDRRTSETVYAGEGPVELVECPVPF